MGAIAPPDHLELTPCLAFCAITTQALFNRYFSATCKTLRLTSGKGPKKIRVSTGRLWCLGPIKFLWISGYYCLGLKGEFVLPGGNAMGFPSAGARTGLN
jgi:hypothetical protein